MQLAVALTTHEIREHDQIREKEKQHHLVYCLCCLGCEFEDSE